MKTKTSWWAVRGAAVLVLAVAIGAPAEPRTPRHLGAVINDYTLISGGSVLVVTGDASVTANGNVVTPFDRSGGTSQLTVCISGGPNVPYANVTLQFGKPAPMHFGSQAIYGVVRNASFEGHP